MKWVELGVHASKLRFDTLSEFLNENGCENSVEYCEATPSTFEEKLKECMENFEAIRLGRGFGELVMSFFNNHTAVMSLLRSADSIVKIDDKWWLRSATYAAFQKKIASIGETLDLNSSVLIVGAGAMTRVAVATLVKAGFKHVNISNKFDDQATELIADLKRIYFGVEFTFVPKDELILLPGTNGVLVNTTPFVEHNDILDELYYFNFLKAGGIAVDFVVNPPLTPLLTEAKDIGAHIIQGVEIAASADVIWGEWCFGNDLNTQNYHEKLREKVLKNPPSSEK